ncbi:MAG: 2-hydroxyacyl-CoA dehydratase family protein [Mogibacterium sp.]|nr:2-hydroxyacyl-CoA dehydratase family protein [Mogibacterium sp.]
MKTDKIKELAARYLCPSREKGDADRYQDGTAIEIHREWRGLADTAYDYTQWCKLWGTLIKWVAAHPVQDVKAIWRYRWMFSYLTVPSFFDRLTQGQKGAALRATRNNLNYLAEHVTENLDIILSADMNLHPGSKKAEELNKKIICTDELLPALIGKGFPNCKQVLYQMIPMYLPSLINQHSPVHYIGQSEIHGLPADVCPLPSFEAGLAIEDDFPKIGCCMLTSNMPCDGSIMTTMIQDRRIGLPTNVLNVPLRWLRDEVQEYAVAEFEEAIKFIEDHTGEKFDWDAFKQACEIWNQQNECKFEKWELNKTAIPPHTGAAAWLYRIFEHQKVCGEPKALANDRKVNAILQKQVAEGKCPKTIKHRAILWNTPCNNYANFNNWLLECWGVDSVVEMIDLHGDMLIDTSSHESMLLGAAKMYQTSTMRAHTKGGYEQMVYTLWEKYEEYDCDMLIMFDQISCKGVGAISGLFEEGARARGIKMCTVRQDLMDPTSITRRDMRRDVNIFMQTVMGETPVDPTLVDFDDDQSW